VTKLEAQQKVLRNPNKFLGKSASVESPTNELAPTGFPSMDSERARSPEESLGLSLQPPLPDWVLDLPEDLDVWIAQRNFIEAVNHYESFQEFLESQVMSSSLKEVKYV